MARALTAKQAMQELNLSRSKLYRMIQAGEIKHIRAGRKVLIPEWCIEEYLRRTAI